MKLKTINTILRKVGLLLVVEAVETKPGYAATSIEIMTVKGHARAVDRDALQKAGVIGSPDSTSEAASRAMGVVRKVFADLNLDLSGIPEGWIVQEIGQSPLRHLWSCILIRDGGHHEFCGDGPAISAGGEEFSTAQTALDYAIQQAIEFDEKHDDQTSDQGREEGPADAAGQ